MAAITGYLLEWLSLILRWTHVVAALGWIGASLYLFSHGERGGDARLKWPAYATWLAGFALLSVAYYANADTYFIAIGIATLVVGLAGYEALCRSGLGDIALLVFLAMVAWALAQLFDGRAAFIHYGALLGTIMAGNVAHVAVPVERRRARALREGKEPDAMDAARQAQRAGHNTVLVIPVVYAMIANHYAVSYNASGSWLTLVVATLAGGALRGRLHAK